ncbi:MAG: GDSL-type esterase/lipase family protein [Bacteroidia bacterium]
MLKNKLLANVLLVCLFLGGACGFYMLGREAKKKWIVHVTLLSKHWNKRYAEMKNTDTGKYKVVFAGNSLTEMFDLTAYFGDPEYLNCGIVGDFSEGLAKRAGLIAALKPEKLFLEIGINDIIEKISLNEICGNYRKVIETIKKESPSTKIYIQSNIPLIIRRFSPLSGNEGVNKLVVEQNENLKKIAAEYGCTYIDLYSEFIKEKDEGSLFIDDGIHLSDKAYTIWSKCLAPYLVSENK